jgi:hypothetical protein
MCGDPRADHPVVIGQYARIDLLTDPPEKRRRALDVRE